MSGSWISRKGGNNSILVADFCLFARGGCSGWKSSSSFGRGFFLAACPCPMDTATGTARERVFPADRTVTTEETTGLL